MAGPQIKSEPLTLHIIEPEGGSSNHSRRGTDGGYVISLLIK